MSTMYVDQYAMLDVSFLIAATCLDGHGAADGASLIACLLGVGTHTEHVVLAYPTAAERDSAFQAMGQLVRAQDALSAGEASVREGSQDVPACSPRVWPRPS